MKDTTVDFKKFRRETKMKFISKKIMEEEFDHIASIILDKSLGEIIMLNTISTKEKRAINKAVQRRLLHEPISSIFKSVPFYRYEFIVNSNVLTPRIDSEVVIDVAKKYIKKDDLVLDIGTGSGALAITLYKECQMPYIYASDISKSALKVAKKNTKKNKANVKFIHSDMFKKIDTSLKFDVIVSNPPYIESQEISYLDKEVTEFDPKLALDGGEDGLSFYRILEEESINHLNEDGLLILEIGYNQRISVERIFSERYELVEFAKDYGWIDRVMVFKIKKENK